MAAARAQDTSVITEIVIRGNKFVTTEAIRSRMKTREQQPYVQKNLDDDKEAIGRMGFFKAVDVKAVPLSGNNFRVEVDVAEFAVVKEIRIVGNTAVQTAAIQKVVTIALDQPFNLDARVPTANAIQELYKKAGSFALVEAIEPLEDSPSTVSISIREAKVASVVITGNTRTKSRVLQRIVKTRPGEVYNEPKWIKELQGLLSSQWFEKVDYDRRSENGYDVDLSVALKEARTAQVVFGAAIDPRSSFAGQLGLVDTNFRGLGQNVGINYSQAIQGGASLDMSFRNPFMDSRDTSMDLAVFSRVVYRFGDTSLGSGSSSISDQLTERRTGGSVSFSRPRGLYERYGVGFRFEGVKTTNIGSTAATDYAQQDGTLGVLSLSYNRNNRDFDLDPSRGSWMNFSMEPGFADISSIGGALTDPALLGKSTFVRNTLEYRSYFTSQPRRDRELDAPRRVLAFRAKAGYISGKAPFFEQFFAGGSDTVRGYQDDRFWGKQMLMSTLEYRHPVQKSFNLIAFVDYGGAWGGFGKVRDFDQSDKMKLHLGYGLGVGFRTPLGPIRLDFGIGEGGKTRTHFLLGTSF